MAVEADQTTAGGDPDETRNRFQLELFFVRRTIGQYEIQQRQGHYFGNAFQQGEDNSEWSNRRFFCSSSTLSIMESMLLAFLKDLVKEIAVNTWPSFLSPTRVSEFGMRAVQDRPLIPYTGFAWKESLRLVNQFGYGDQWFTLPVLEESHAKVSASGLFPSSLSVRASYRRCSQ